MDVVTADTCINYASYSVRGNPLNLVVFSGPQQSLFEMKNLAELLDGKTVSVVKKA